MSVLVPSLLPLLLLLLSTLSRADLFLEEPLTVPFVSVVDIGVSAMMETVGVDTGVVAGVSDDFFCCWCCGREMGVEGDAVAVTTLSVFANRIV